jgi:dTDP-4-amino-4,6-dideoxygalactose transaminase
MGERGPGPGCYRSDGTRGVSTSATSAEPAIRGGTPLFPDGLPLARPAIPDVDRVASDVRDVLVSGQLTNGPRVRALEERAADVLEVRHAVAVSTCTAGLMLVLRATELTGDVVLPSFTFQATAHAVAWNGLRPAFADVDADTLTLSAEAASRATGMRTAAILATHTYGTPADVEGLTEKARQSGVRLFFDAAHAFGSRHGDRPVGGFGDAEVFSLTPTKPVVAGEGGIVATNEAELAASVRRLRDYGKEDDYDVRVIGLNARMSELHAAVALGSLDGLDERITRRNELAAAYRDVLGTIPGISFPGVRPGDVSTFKDFTVLVDPDRFGIDAGTVGEALAAEGVETRRYYAPPIHRTTAYRAVANGVRLPVTEDAAARVLTLPLWVGMTRADIDRLGEALDRIRRSGAVSADRGRSASTPTA